MSVLSRRKNESIIINDDFTIVVIDIRVDKVRLGVEAPKELPIFRSEVPAAIRRFNRQQGFRDVGAPWAETPYSAPAAEPRAAAVAPPPVRDGLCCPACGSDAVDVGRIKVAYQGKELVRRRKCDACSNEFHTVERVELR